VEEMEKQLRFLMAVTAFKVVMAAMVATWTPKIVG
jgi:hypothetical protein